MAYTHFQTWVTDYVRGMPSQDGDLQGVISVYYEQDIPNNKTKIRIDHKVRAYLNLDAVGQSIYLDPIESRYRVNNGSYGGTYQSVMRPHEWFTQDGFELRLISSTYHTVTHNSDGTCKLYVQGSIRGWMQINSRFGGYVYDGSFEEASAFSKDLPTIPRYANITSYSVVNNGLNSIRVTWNTDATCDSSQYSLNGGAWQNAPAWKDFTIGNLSPGTQYSVKIRVKRADSQLWTESSVKYATTTDIARITSAPDNIDPEQPFTVNFSNPSGASISLAIYKENYEFLIGYRTVTGGSYTFNLTTQEKNAIYNLIPNQNQVKLNIRLRTNESGNSYFHHALRTFRVTNANPIFNNFEYEDINPITLALTGNNQTIIKGYSTLRAIISTSNKAVAQKGASIVSYQLVVGEKQKTVAYSDSTDVNIDLTEIENNIFTVYAIDSRGNSTTKQISPTEYIAYSKVVLLNGQAERTGGIGDETTLKFNGTFYNVDFGSSSNSLTITYKYKKTSLPDLEENWVDGTTTITPSITDNNFSFENIIAGDKGALGFDSNYSYDIKIIATDELSSTSYDLVLGTGKPNIAIHRNGVSFNAPFDEEDDSANQFTGKSRFKNDAEIDGLLQLKDELKVEGNKIVFKELTLFEWVEEE